MKANELRIGSKFLSAFGNVETVLSISDNTARGSIEFVSADHRNQYSHIICCEENRNQYKPFEITGVPITDEWLEKFGFEKAKNKKAFGENHWWKNGVTVDLFGYRCEAGLKVELVRLKYVHQLQNLYFALTGEELEIKVAQPA